MKPNYALVALVALVAAAVSALTTLALHHQTAPAPREIPAVAPRNDQEVLSRRVAELEREMARLEAPIVAPDDDRQPVDDLAVLVRREVERWMDERGAGAGDAAAVQRRPSEAGLLEQLVDQRLSDAQRAEVLRSLRERGDLDEAIARLEQLAAVAPHDAGAQYLLGQAYIEKIVEGVDGPTAGELAAQADAAFDQALAADPSHWEARYAKASSLGYWPAATGKKGEMIEQLETLVQQQATLPSQAKFVQSHVLLGTAYQQMGNEEKAKQAWLLGLQYHPNDESLEQLLGALEQP